MLGRFTLDIRKSFSLRGRLGTETGFPEKQSQPNSAQVQKAFGHCFHAHGMTLGIVLCRAMSWTLKILVGPCNSGYSMFLHEKVLKQHIQGTSSYFFFSHS